MSAEFRPTQCRRIRGFPCFSRTLQISCGSVGHEGTQYGNSKLLSWSSSLKSVPKRYHSHSSRHYLVSPFVLTRNRIFRTTTMRMRLFRVRLRAMRECRAGFRPPFFNTASCEIVWSRYFTGTDILTFSDLLGRCLRCVQG